MTGDPVPEALHYAYRPSLLGAGYEFVLGAHGLDWTAGARSGHVPYRSIRCIRMSYRPMSMQSHRFITELWADDAPRLQIVSTSWKSVVEQERLDAAYARFVTALHRCVADAGAAVVYRRGRDPLVYWPGLAAFVLVAFALVALVMRALQTQALGAAALIALFLLLFVWQGGSFFRRNRPGRYSPDALPPELLPRNVP
jgi:hypothetical protein